MAAWVRKTQYLRDEEEREKEFLYVTDRVGGKYIFGFLTYQLDDIGFLNKTDVNFIMLTSIF